MIITTYYSLVNKYKQFFEDIYKIAISISVPKYFSSMKKVYHAVELAPSWDLLSMYKNGNISWDEYVIQYKKDKFTNDEVIYILNDIKEKAFKKPVLLICYEKDFNKCHRSLIYEFYKNLGVKVIEMQEDNIFDIINIINNKIIVECNSALLCKYANTAICKECNRNKSLDEFMSIYDYFMQVE